MIATEAALEELHAPEYQLITPAGRVFTREAYLQRREYLIFDGNPPATGYEDIFEEEDDSESQLKIE